VLDLNAVVSDTEKMLRRVIGEDIELQTSLDSGLGAIRADQTQIEQVLLNLCVNARDAMPDGGKLIISTQSVELTQSDVLRYPYPVKPGPYVLLNVTDNGIGMNSEVRAHIFEPFFTTKEKGKGTGMGLATVYGIVKQSDGYIEVHSELGTGAVFKILLPQVNAEPQLDRDNRKAIPAVSPEKGHETILVVEDERAIRQLTVNMLRRLGYSVLEASDSKEALETCQRYIGVVDLLLTDVIMPGMNGRALAEQLTVKRPQIQILYMSGHTGQGVGQGVLPLGCNFIAKPFTRDNLAQKIRAVLHSQAAAPCQ